MHITDDDEWFLSEMDPDAYVDSLVRSRSQSAVAYAHSHVGLCYFPTKVGRMHRGLRGPIRGGSVVWTWRCSSEATPGLSPTWSSGPRSPTT